jgi:cellulose synthase/poly-beta-1,6-N-acetylglucosamine synthase-like glycosyltransferase
MKKAITVSVGTSAFNEQENIRNMLKSVLRQECASFVLKEVLVMSDGSTDNTVKLASKIEDKRIKIFEDNKRMGKPSRVNMMLKMFKGDIFILLDADMIMKNNKVIEYLVSGFKNDRKTGLVGGNAYPIKGKTFMENAINNYLYSRMALEKFFDYGNSAYGAHGFLAYSRKFAKSLTLPKNILNDDAFSYFACLKKGFKFNYVKNAVILYRSPQTIKDHIAQSTRHLAGGIQLYKYFEKEVVDREFSMPGKVLLAIMLRQLLYNPLGYFVLRVLNFYCSIKVKSNKVNTSINWDTINSSKKLIATGIYE